jgi:acyl-CoA synthetase (NDP forming)
MFGLGGVFAEVLNDVAVRVLPIAQREPSNPFGKSGL